MQLRPHPLLRALNPVRLSRLMPGRPPRIRRARAAALLGLALIVAAQLGMSAAVETVKPEWRDPEYGHRLKRLRTLIDENPNCPLVVALGSSRTQMGLSPAMMDFPDEAGPPLVFNFALAGAGPVHMQLTLDRLLDAGIKPDFLLVEYYPVALATDGPAEEVLKSWGPRLGLADLQRLEPQCRDSSSLHREWAANRIAPWHSLRLVLMSHWQPNWLPWQQRQAFMWDQMDRLGWIPFPYDRVEESTRRRSIDRVREEHQALLADYRIGRASDRALRDMIARCRREGIPVALYLTPEGPAFRSWYSHQTMETVSSHAAGLTRELGVPLFDSTSGFAEEEFADGHHLLKSGAARFSRRLVEEHLRNWIRKESAARPAGGTARH